MEHLRDNNVEAVSAVIGVILMVAVTIAMAAVAYAYFTGMIGSNQEETPLITFQLSESEGRIEVIGTEPNIFWDEFSLRADKDYVTFSINSDVVAGAGVDLPYNTLTAISYSNRISSSDYIDLEGEDLGGGGPTEVTGVTITIVHDETDVVIGTYTFGTISAAD